MNRVAGYVLVGIYAAGAWIYGLAYIWTHWAGFWNIGSIAYYAFTRAIFWPIILTASLILNPSGPSLQAMGLTAPHATSYSTTGSATIETGRNVEISWCSSTTTTIPAAINAEESSWRGVWQEQKSDGRTMCYRHIEDGFFTTRSLRFECKPMT